MSMAFRLTAALALTFALPTAGAALAAPACEPAKLAEKYPTLVGKTVKIGADPQTPPYVMREGNDFNKVVGFDADLAAAALDCVGVKHEFFLGSWGGLLPATVGGQVDVFWNNLYYKPERAKQVDFVLYMQAGTGALVAAGNPKGITSIENTCGTTVAVGLGTVEVEVMNKQSEKCQAEGKQPVTVVTYPDVAAGTRLIQTSRADAMLTDLALVEAFAQDNPKLYAKGFSILSGLTIGAAVRNGDKDLLNAIKDGIEALQADGSTKKLYAKYKIDPAMEVPAEIKLD
jgi:polar amino acid transport system substrate-binding protein